MKNARLVVVLPGRVWWAGFVCGVGLIAGLAAGPAARAAAPGFSISPAIVTNDYLGKVTLLITNLAAGKTVRVEKFPDFNTNGVLNSPELAYLFRSFTVTDGQPPLLAGGTNLNVAGDMDGATNGQIRADLFYPGVNATLDQFVMKYLVRVSDPAGTFSLTNSFEVRPKVYPQGISGKLVASGTGTALTNAVVVLFQQNAPGALGAAVDGGGNFKVYCATGSYSLVSISSGYVSGASVMINPNVITNLNMTNKAATLTLAGKVSDLAGGAGLPGIGVQVTGTNGFTYGTTDTNGNYSLKVTSGTWTISVDGSAPAGLGYVGLQKPKSITTNVTANLSGLNFQLPKGTVLVHGRVTDNFGNPMPGLSFYAEDSLTNYEVNGESYAPDGGYALALTAGDWNFGPDNDNPALAGYQVQGTELTFTNGQVQEVDFIAQSCSSVQITNTSLPVGQVGSPYDDFLDAASCSSNLIWSVVSGAPGWLLLNPSTGELTGTPGAPGTNTLTVQVQDGNNNFTNRSWSLMVTGAAPALQVITGLLPDGTNGLFYSTGLSATGGQPPYSWSVTPGYAGPPANLTLGTNGIISGIPASGGTFYLEARATDALGANADSPLLSLNIANLPLAVATTSLPAAMVGAPYGAQLSASGGQSPYTWSLALGSAPLPANLALSPGGLLSGTVASPGTNFFVVQAMDFWGSSATRVLSLAARAAVPLLTAPTVVSAGQIQMTLSGAAGQSYNVEYSTNLVNWSLLLATNLQAVTTVQLHLQATNHYVFYRAYQTGVVTGQAQLGYDNVGSPPVFHVNPTNGSVTVPVTAISVPGSAGLTNQVCLNYATIDGTARAGIDYSAASGTVCFAPGSTSNNIVIPVYPDPTNFDATFYLELTDPNSGAAFMMTIVIQNPRPVLAVYPAAITLNVPGNCPQTVTISNAGPQGSLLNYTVADDGALGGFLNFNSQGPASPTQGSLAAGQSAPVDITVLSQFATNWIGGNLTTAPNVYAPGAANHVKFPLSVSINSIQQNVGTWSGTWSGTNNAIPPQPSGGTWQLNIQSFNMPPTSGNISVTGTFAMQGSDSFPTGYGTDAAGDYIIQTVPVSLNISGAVSFPMHYASNSCVQSFSSDQGLGSFLGVPVAGQNNGCGNNSLNNQKFQYVYNYLGETFEIDAVVTFTFDINDAGMATNSAIQIQYGTCGGGRGSVSITTGRLTSSQHSP
jgi:Calx-beta domain/Putative Ig domain